jgi:hypothetical protein
MLPVAEVVRAHDVVHGRRRPNGCMAWRAKAAVRTPVFMAEVVRFIYHFSFELLFDLGLLFDL